MVFSTAGQSRGCRYIPQLRDGIFYTAWQRRGCRYIPYSGIVLSKQLGRGEVAGIQYVFPYSGMVFSKQLDSMEGASIPLLRDGIF
jgi:hypothetical protein